MPAVEAVKVAAQARKHARASLDRMIYHLGRNNPRGWRREQAFLNALERAALRQTQRAAGVASQVIPNIGGRAVAQLTGGRASIARASMLASFSESIMAPARDVKARRLEAGWVWTANQSACSACLGLHGHEHSGVFIPLHPSCLCMPDQRGLARPLDKLEIADLLIDRGGRDARLGRLIYDGILGPDDLAQRVGKWTVQPNRELPLTGAQVEQAAQLGEA